MPDVYWFTQLMFIKMKMKQEWKYFWEPQGELIGSIAEPSVFQEYVKQKKQVAKRETAEEAKAAPVYQDGVFSAEADLHYDPDKGLVNGAGQTMIPEEAFKKDSNIGGVAISY